MENLEPETLPQMLLDEKWCEAVDLMTVQLELKSKLYMTALSRNINWLPLQTKSIMKYIRCNGS